MAPSGACSRCGKEATLQCRHIEPDGSASHIFYCSKDCQIQDWPKHKTSCQQSRQRDRLFKTGELLKALMLLFSDKVNIMDFANVHVTNDGCIHLYQNHIDEQIFPTYKLDRFPNLSQAERDAIISYKGCFTVFSPLRWLARAGLRAFGPISIRLVKTKTFAAKLRVHMMKDLDANGVATVYYHELPAWDLNVVLEVCLNDGIDYIVDPLGACFQSQSDHRAVRRWDEYLHEVVDECLQRTPFVDVDTHYLESLVAGPFPAAAHGAAAKKMRASITAKDLSNAAKQPRPIFETAKTQLVERARSLIDVTFAPFSYITGYTPPGYHGTPEVKQWIADLGKRECGLTYDEDEAVTALEQKYGRDTSLIDYVKKARATLEVDDFAELGMRCVQLQSAAAKRHKLEEMLQAHTPPEFIDTSKLITLSGPPEKPDWFDG